MTVLFIVYFAEECTLDSAVQYLYKMLYRVLYLLLYIIYSIQLFRVQHIFQYSVQYLLLYSLKIALLIALFWELIPYCFKIELLIVICLENFLYYFVPWKKYSKYFFSAFLRRGGGPQETAKLALLEQLFPTPPFILHHRHRPP